MSQLVVGLICASLVYIVIIAMRILMKKENPDQYKQYSLYSMVVAIIYTVAVIVLIL